jgi:hypothetical protein
MMKLFKKQNINIAYTTNNNTNQLLQLHNELDPYKKNGVYQLACLTCNKRYVGQTGRPFQTPYKEHRREYLHSTLKSNLAKHLTEEGHPLPPPMADCMEILQYVNMI